MSLYFCFLSATVHLCSFLCQASTHESSSFGVLVFTSNLLIWFEFAARLAASLRHVPGFPKLRLLRRLCHSRDIAVNSHLGFSHQPLEFPTFTCFPYSGIGHPTPPLWNFSLKVVLQYPLKINCDHNYELVTPSGTVIINSFRISTLQPLSARFRADSSLKGLQPLVQLPYAIAFAGAPVFVWQCRSCATFVGAAFHFKMRIPS